MIITKKEFLEKLERNKSYQRALKAVNADQRSRIEKIMDSFMGHAVDKMAPVIDRLNEDPDYVRQVKEHMRRDSESSDEVIIDEEQHVSGSKID